MDHSNRLSTNGDSGKYMLPLPDMASLYISNETTRQLMIRDLLNRIMHKPDRQWFDLYTPLEVNGVFLGNGGFIITLLTFSEIDPEKCSFDTLDQLYLCVQQEIGSSLNHFCINYVVEIDGLIAAIATFPRTDEAGMRSIGNELEHGVVSHCEKALQQLRLNHGISMKMFTGHATYGISSLPEAYHNVYNFWKYDEYTQGCFPPHLPHLEKTAPLIPLDHIRAITNELVQILNSDHFTEASELFSDILDDLVAAEPHMLPLVQSRLLSFIVALTDKLIGEGIFTENDIPVTNMINEIHRASLYSELKDYLTDCLDLLISIRVRRQHVSTDSQIRRIKAYIGSTYSDPNLTVGKIADTFGISQSHLSSLFKSQTGTRLADYIHEVRISNAITMLEKSEESIERICTAVGYGSLSTFFRAFKKYRKTTPSAYRTKPSGQ